MTVLGGHVAEFINAFLVTIALTLASAAGAFVVGVLTGCARVSSASAARVSGAVYVEVVRSIPPAALLVLFYFGLPELNLALPAFPTTVTVLALYSGAYVAEAIRSGVNSIDRRQIRAGRALGLSGRQLIMDLIIPQALRLVIPPIGNLFIDLTKYTALAYTISVIEITGNASELISRTADAVPIFLAAAASYLVLTIPAGWFFRILERRVAVRT